MKKVKFHLNRQLLRLGHRNLLRSFIENLIKKERCGLKNIEIIFCDDPELLNLNRHFLHHDYFTDILTFNLGSGKAIEGEIYISIPRVRENALQLKIPFSEELHRVIIHGVLHLTGYTDEIRADRLKMEHRQELYLKQYLDLVNNK